MNTYVERKPMSMERQHVVMLVNNPCVNDSRVIKTAEAVARTGRRVTVLCRRKGDLPWDEIRAGVRYLRVSIEPLTWKQIWQHLLGSGRSEFRSTPMDEGKLTSPLMRLWEVVRAVPKIAIATLFALGHKLFMGIRWLLVTLQEGSVNFWKKIRAIYVPVNQAVRDALGKSGRYLNLRKKKLQNILKRYSKLLLRKVYWFVETDEYGAAVEPQLRALVPDVIHAHDLGTLPVGGRVARSLGIRLIYDSHELEMHRNANYSKLVKLRRRWLESKYIRRADTVITVSESIADHLRNDYHIARPTVVMNAPSLNEAVSYERDIRSDLNLEKDVKLAVYVGSVTINRGIELAVRAMVYIPDAIFATVGPRQPATEEEVAAIADELGVRDRIHFVDPVRPEEVVSYIRTADVSVLPIQNVCLSYYYCMPNKLLESVFAGVPVAVANLHEMKLFVEKYRCGLVMNELDPADIARAIQEVLENREKYVLEAEMRDEVAEEYGWPKQSARLCLVYEGFNRPPASRTPAAH